MLITRKQTHKVMVGNVQIGHQNKVVIQSMTNTKTSNIKNTLTQIKELVKNGCELVRVAILDEKDVIALKQLTKLSPCPIIADIHYNNKLALLAIQNGVAKIRINPTNLPLDQLKKIINEAKKYQVVIRIGINSGSKLNNRSFKTPSEMIKCALTYIRQFEKWSFNKIIVSLKSSNPFETIKLYQLASQKIRYPLHLGVTESGSHDNAIIKSTIGLAPLLQQGIGDTLRISMSGDPINEPIVSKKLLSNFNLCNNIPQIISCPTCGRLQWNLIRLLNNVENYCKSINKKMSIVIMGCSVNGIGECEKADIGVYGSKQWLFLFKNGKFYKKISINSGFKEIINLINKM